MPVPPEPTRCPSAGPLEPIGILLLLKAFAGGSVALTGVEAIANGVPGVQAARGEERRQHDDRDGRSCSAILFIGLTVVAVAVRTCARPSAGGAVDRGPGRRGRASATGPVLFVTFAASTALILFLAANTSFNAFPRLAAILAEDGYMPRQFSFRGDRLAYSWGIVLLAAIAFGLLWAFGGDTHALIPLYSVGVFVCFTLSQIGMVRHWLRGPRAGLALAAGVNAVGRRPDRGRPRSSSSTRSSATAPTSSSSSSRSLVGMMLFIQPPVRALEARARGRARPHRPARRTARSGSSSRSRASTGPSSRRSTSARSISRRRPRRLHLRRPERRRPVSRADFERQIPGVPLVVVESPYRALAGPLLAYLDVLDAGLAAGQAGADHVRRHPRVRRPQLVGADPLQPGGQAAADGPARAAAHGRRQRPVPARGPGAVRGDAGGAARARRGRDRPTTGRRRYRTASSAMPAGRAACAGGIVTSHVRCPSAASSSARSSPSTAARATRGSSASSPSRRAHRKAELIAVHVVEIDWTLPLDADIAGRSEEVQRVLDIAEAVAEDSKVTLEPVLLQARDVGAAIVDEAIERGADLLVVGPALSQAVRRRVRHRPDHPVHPAERAVRGLGRARADAEESS